MAAARGRPGGRGLASEKTQKLTAWSADFTSGFGEGNDGWTPSIPVKNVCRPTCTHTHSPCACRARLIVFILSPPRDPVSHQSSSAYEYLLKWDTHGEDVGVCFHAEVFLNARLAGDEETGGRLELKRPFTFSPERVSAVGAARDIRPPASPPLVSSIMCGSSLRRVSERLPISAPYAREPPSLLPLSEMSSVVCRRRSPIQPDDNCRVDTSLDL